MKQSRISNWPFLPWVCPLPPWATLGSFADSCAPIQLALFRRSGLRRAPGSLVQSPAIAAAAQSAVPRPGAKCRVIGTVRGRSIKLQLRGAWKAAGVEDEQKPLSSQRQLTGRSPAIAAAAQSAVPRPGAKCRVIGTVRGRSIKLQLRGAWKAAGVEDEQKPLSSQRQLTGRPARALGAPTPSAPGMLRVFILYAESVYTPDTDISDAYCSVVFAEFCLLNFVPSPPESGHYLAPGTRHRHTLQFPELLDTPVPRRPVHMHAL
ncbi:Dysferlin [Tupaia chinensis]|uniref:Dysferlin n=1 Tax=Tupaia chinensis TaxID=246437 RepID=L9KNL7_TUPCH|nr:Dysferlin [Tupaia chinensis]